MKKTIFAAACAMAACSFDEILVKDGDTLAFLGDSITQQGQQNPDGYVNLTIRALASEGVRHIAQGASPDPAHEGLRPEGVRHEVRLDLPRPRRRRGLTVRFIFPCKILGLEKSKG